jgi:hypothetical protein
MKKKREGGDDEGEDIIKKEGGQEVKACSIGWWSGGAEGKKGKGSRPHASLALALARKMSLSYLVFKVIYLFFRSTSQRAPSPSRALIRHYVNTPNTPLHRVLHSHTCPYTYKYTSLDHPF